MRWPLQIALALLFCFAAMEAPAPDFKLADGAVITGELVAPNEEGTVIRRSNGVLTSRIGWDRFSQETLMQMVDDPGLKELVEAYVEYPDPPEEELEVIEVSDPPGLIKRPARRPSLSAAFGTQAGLFILFILFAANLYAAYEIARYRNYPPLAVIGASVILPILGPILFLCMPERVEESVAAPAPDPMPDPGPSPAQEMATAGLAGSGLSLSAAKSASTSTQAVSYRRGEVEFNRSFFERTFPHFFRLTRSDPDKDSVLSIRSAKGEVIATRISRISGNEMSVMTQKGQEVPLRFGEIVEVQIKPKGA